MWKNLYMMMEKSSILDDSPAVLRISIIFKWQGVVS